VGKGHSNDASGLGGAHPATVENMLWLRHTALLTNLLKLLAAEADIVNATVSQLPLLI